MSKELELFQELRYEYLKTIKDDKLDLIEKALKEYELMKNTRFIVVDKKISDEDLEKLKDQRIIANGSEESKVELLFDEETQKKLQALEIIKEKHIDCMFFIEKDFDNYGEYIEYMCRHNLCVKENIFEVCYGILTQEEYDLLKEIFDE